jgi:hypothetical protein
MFYFGLVCGIVFEIFYLVEKSFKMQKWICLICDILQMITGSIIFVLAKNITNFGEFRFYLLIPFVLGIIMLHFFVGKLVEKFLILLYNVFVKAKNKLCFKFKKLRKRKQNAK